MGLPPRRIPARSPVHRADRCGDRPVGPQANRPARPTRDATRMTRAPTAEAGFVERRRYETHRNSRFVVLTDQGREVLPRRRSTRGEHAREPPGSAHPRMVCQLPDISRALLTRPTLVSPLHAEPRALALTWGWAGAGAGLPVVGRGGGGLVGRTPQVRDPSVVWRGGGGFFLLPRRVIVAARTARVKAMVCAVLMGLVALTRVVRAAVGRLSGKGEEWLRRLTAPGPSGPGFGPVRPQAAGSLPFPLAASLSASPRRDRWGNEEPATGGVDGGPRPRGGRDWQWE